MEEVIKFLLSEAGLAGLVIAILIYAVIKLYRDLRQIERTLYKEGMKGQDRYREVVMENNKTLLHMEQVFDRMIELEARRK